LNPCQGLRAIGEEITKSAKLRLESGAGQQKHAAGGCTKAETPSCKSTNRGLPVTSAVGGLVALFFFASTDGFSVW
jgi:hypothetical protein